MIIGIAGRAQSGKDTVAKIIQYLNSKEKMTLRTLDTITEFNEFCNSSYTPNNNDWKVVKFADKLKDIVCIITGCTREQLEDNDFKNSLLNDEWKHHRIQNERAFGSKLLAYNPTLTHLESCSYTYRQTLQGIGTDLLRNWFHPNTWVNATMADYHTSYFKYGDVIYVLQKNGTYSLEGHELESCMSKADMIELGATEYPQCNWLISDVRFPNECEAIKDRGGIVIRVNRNFTWEKDGQQLLSDDEFKRFKDELGITEHPSETALDDYAFDYTINNLENTLENLLEQVKGFTDTKLFKDL